MAPREVVVCLLRPVLRGEERMRQCRDVRSMRDGEVMTPAVVILDIPMNGAVGGNGQYGCNALDHFASGRIKVGEMRLVVVHAPAGMGIDPDDEGV